MDFTMELKARAKINLSLDVLRKRPDGYHDVEMIMQTVDLHDRIFIDMANEGIQVKCNLPWLPSDSENIAYKAANLLLNRFKLNRGVNIRIDKRIPVAAGLAGGSSNAAAVLKGMNELFSLGLSEQELMALGKEIGADVPFCVKGGTMLSEGIGEILTELKPFSGVGTVLVKPKISVSTAWVYQNLVLDKIIDRPDTGKMVAAINRMDIRAVAGNMKNVLETVTQQKYGIIKEIKDKLVGLGACGSMMSGSGPTVFGIFSDKQAARKAFEGMKGNRWDCYLTETTCEGR